MRKDYNMKKQESSVISQKKKPARVNMTGAVIKREDVISQKRLYHKNERKH